MNELTNIAINNGKFREKSQIGIGLWCLERQSKEWAELPGILNSNINDSFRLLEDVLMMFSQIFTLFKI